MASPKKSHCDAHNNYLARITQRSRATIEQLSWACWADIRECGLDSQAATKAIENTILKALESKAINPDHPNGVNKDGTRKADNFRKGANAGVNAKNPSHKGARRKVPLEPT